MINPTNLVEREVALEGDYIPLEEQFDEPVKRHHYTLGYMTSYIFLILKALSMRSVEVVLEFFTSLIPNCFKIPTHYSGRLWLLKLGLYNLLKLQEKAEDWIWIVDHLVQAGVLKCLVILGIRLKDLPKDRPLNRDDVEVLLVQPVEQSNGEIVYQQLLQLTSKTGTPRAMVGDHGTDIKSGIEKFCSFSGGTIYLYDIKHCTANLLKAKLGKDEIWISFIELAATTKKYLQQTELACLMPPNQRSKARYMNLEELVSWGITILKRLDSGNYPTDIDAHKLQCKLGWLPFFRNDLASWERIINRAIAAETHIRTYGYMKGTSDEIQTLFTKMSSCEQSLDFEAKVIQAIKTEESKLHIGERQLGSTEILESSFGCFKEFAKVQSSSGFTESILALPAMFSKTTAQDIKSAIEGTTVKQIKEWTSTNIGKTVQGQRIEWLGKKNMEQNRDEELAA